jgi:hypothetical protein
MKCYTDDEAQKMLCPMDFTKACKGRKCMAWRWATVTSWEGGLMRTKQGSEGYCGMVRDCE